MERLEIAIAQMCSSRLLEMKLRNRTGKQGTRKERFEETGG